MSFKEFVYRITKSDSVLSFPDKHGNVYVAVWNKQRFKGIIEIQTTSGTIFTFPTLLTLYENCISLCPNTELWVFSTP